MHELQKSEDNDVLFKVHFEKGPPILISLVVSTVDDAKVVVKVTEHIGPCFK
jgi:hypothetical protein